MTREEFYNLTDILNSEVLGNFMHGGEADELLAMFEEAVDHSNILEQEESASNDLEEAAFDYAEACKYDGGEKLLCVEHFKAGAEWNKKHQADKDLGLTWKDIEKVCLIAREVHQFRGFWSENVYQEVLKRFKEKKGE